MFNLNLKGKLIRLKIKKNVRIFGKKMQEVANTLETNPNHYKNLHKPLQEYKRVHVNGSYVILFIVDEDNRKVIFHNYAHHDDIYIKR